MVSIGNMVREGRNIAAVFCVRDKNGIQVLCLQQKWEQCWSLGGLPVFLVCSADIPIGFRSWDTEFEERILLEKIFVTLWE